MNSMRGSVRWAVVTLALVTACTQPRYRSSPESEDHLQASAQALLASSIAVSGAALATGATVAVRVTGPSYDATLPTGTGLLPPITNDGTYTVANAAADALFGTFTVEAGVVVHASGAVTFAGTGISFDTTKLATVNVASGALTVPANQGSYRLGTTSSTFQGSPTFRLPDGTFSVSSPDGTRALGTFTVAARAVVATTGAVVSIAGGVRFDLSALAQISVPFSSISTPSNLASARLGDDSLASNGTLTAYLTDGTYAVTNGDRDRIFGGFTVTGRVVTSTSGGIMTTPTGVGFDTTKLARVTILAASLSAPSILQMVVVPKLGSQPFGTNATFSLPPGTYAVDEFFFAPQQHHFGDFTVTGTTVTSVSGLVQSTPQSIGFDFAQLAAVTIPLSGLQTPAQPAAIVARMQNLNPAMVFGGPFSQGHDELLHLFDGHYTVLRASSAIAWGSFDVANHRVVAGSGAFKAGASGDLQVHTCSLAAVTISAGPPPIGTPFNVLEVMMSGPPPLTSSTLLLPPGPYTIRSAFGGGRPDGSFTVPAQGPITNVVKPSWLATLSGSIGTCLTPPTTTCVGTPSAPVVLPGSCDVTADNTNHLAGSCASGGGGLASCTFDGAVSRELSAGDHAVFVAGAASDGSSSTCTSYVRVAACGDAPIVTCVGTKERPVVVQTEPATCGVGVSAESAVAGTCTPAVGGVLGSCTFDGSASESVGPGSYAIAVSGTSGSGATASCTSYVTVADAEAPEISCLRQTRECEGALTSATASATCSDNCGACGTTCASAMLPVGASVLGCTASDVASNRSSCDSEIAIVDTVAPTLSLDVSPTVLWPPTHELQPIAIATSASDTCDAAPAVTCSASSDESPLTLGSGHTPADIVWTNGKLYLRAERSGLGSGRTYTIACTARDATGNTRATTRTVRVPLNAP